MSFNIVFVAETVKLHIDSLPQRGKGDHEVVDEVFQGKVTFIYNTSSVSLTAATFPHWGRLTTCSIAV